ncbi:hypothetical protein NDU88_006802 [Pleurodeles waltl]|uniref:Uncharacterized protein n=1 Tax=Pleurodeles waltl TaxID=8319 RepID=A0AAV7ME31_PLEWA|nr:hypothetical protein NDU88_006802 [Pleurodeles waltl]
MADPLPASPRRARFPRGARVFMLCHGVGSRSPRFCRARAYFVYDPMRRARACTPVDGELSRRRFLLHNIKTSLASWGTWI